jgi:hypothetical protein
MFDKKVIMNCKTDLGSGAMPEAIEIIPGFPHICIQVSLT